MTKELTIEEIQDFKGKYPKQIWPLFFSEMWERFSFYGMRALLVLFFTASILDQGWGEFRRQLEYKQAWLGGQVIAVPPQYTSQRCACCGHTARANRITQSKFECVACGHTENADINAARNILAAGLAVLACGEAVQSDPSMKQELTKAIQATA